MAATTRSSGTMAGSDARPMAPSADSTGHPGWHGAGCVDGPGSGTVSRRELAGMIAGMAFVTLVLAASLALVIGLGIPMR